MSARKLGPDDYWRVRAALAAKLAQLKASKAKTWFRYIELDKFLEHIFSLEHGYIVDGYLIVFEIEAPHYSRRPFLIETIVFNLEGSDFGAVPAFLERKAKEAGAALIVVGTALARKDAALSALYGHYGYKAETTLLTKEP